ncbi:hypothetical protein CDD80_2583 [Ophiocordyceps camponoti-rufipedis]|uniref:General transcription and DNA repair factor IIH subunit TFB4 n=1 Tax=Ophiocordyceps camponoti-rufipedis TaxID=2004952 RepID=A0A2C5Z7L7_9HYPO|nr:hypothetical protein CDD80_2583 [Ophiocordyceps camponoti-rufipedis]
MDAVDVSDHYEVVTTQETPSLLAMILDTNPRAWAALDARLPLAKAVANMLVFVNAHLAFSSANQVAVVAAHVGRAVWLYPAAPLPTTTTTTTTTAAGEDVTMTDALPLAASANKYPHFAHIEATVMAELDKLLSQTTLEHVQETTTRLSGALTLALSYINKVAQSLGSSAPSTTTTTTTTTTNPNLAKASATAPPPLKGRILVISVSDSEPSQYIPTMNAVFAASHARVAIDTLSLSGDATFLQQAAFNTNGSFLAASNPQGLLTYLMFGLIADTEARKLLMTPTHDKVDFRAACFCHGRVVDSGFVCSICLSIFCEPPPEAECLTCGTKLALGNYGAKPAVAPRKKKRKKAAAVNGTTGREETGSAAGTPRP